MHSGQPDLEVADSFLVDDGRVVALAEHRARFLGDSGFAPQAWQAVLAAVPPAGAWFPRVEKRRGLGHPQLALRPAPPRTDTVVLATAARDPRRLPLVKGPDLDALGAVRADARAAGAGEAVLLAPSGRVVEGTSSALVWWRAGALHVVDAALPRLRSVTEGVVLALAAESGVEVVPALATPAELEGAELWALSSLHGIRAATGWIGGPRLAEPDTGRLAAWRSRWSQCGEPVQNGG